MVLVWLFSKKAKQQIAIPERERIAVLVSPKEKRVNTPSIIYNTKGLTITYTADPNITNINNINIAYMNSINELKNFSTKERLIRAFIMLFF